MGDYPFPSEDAYTIERCSGLAVGEGYQTTCYGVHRYADGWWCLWHHCFTDKDLGRRLKTVEDLRGFMAGRWNTGGVIQFAFRWGPDE